MIMYRGTDEFILDAVRKERGVLGRLILALRIMLSGDILPDPDKR